MTTPIKWPSALSPLRQKLYKRLRQERDNILGSTLLTIDPASISMGWAIFTQGDWIVAGTIEASSKIRADIRVQGIADILKELAATYNPAYVLMEEVRPPAANIQLLWSAGAVLGAVGASLIEVPVNMHQAYSKRRKPGYVKSDAGDAINIGEAIITYCREECLDG